ncbi:MAG TPA: HEXXH motif-containing putative peptide modification protein [Solirubrobacterales bacterium]|nr:HEXXH motif-containing putative peptide modification protein [Solirubrobacterales bacterium]
MAPLSFAEPARVGSNARALVAATGVGGERERPLAYFEALNRIQARPIRLDDLERVPRAVFAIEDPADHALVQHFLEGEEPGPSHLYDAEARERILAGLAAGMDMLERYDPGAAALPATLVARIFFARKPGFGGASTADMLGCIWLSPPRSWEAVDYAEALYHECVHQALFLEEMVQGVYAKTAAEMLEEDAMVVSAIRREKRPFDASFHAACVAAALLDLYRDLDRADRAQPLLEGLRPSLEEIAGKEGCLNANGCKILGELERGVGVAA